ncbi:indole-3-acetaldehyde oxidase isoform X1 [Ceratitis capitata]|uniref:indole-3-acetaldehyde oxidase isoform X1 n=2 Tax=Ceratitis capitata TaxID=7213 RepID=UPI00032A2B5C|nr:indole-3-acetaldehyde oxidase isoform X1 [Ceratitis capitata]
MSTAFRINGRSYTVRSSSLPADITLNTFIREHAGLSGTKFMCQEGGCGVCVCVVTGRHPVTGNIHTWAVNSCLTLLNTCVDWDITTIEGIGSKRVGYHPIQKRLAKMNGTQCGFCSPGFVMNMYGLLESKAGEVTMQEVENSFGGNICRCTGYRPILDAMKSFAVDSTVEIPKECQDIEDLSKKICPKDNTLCKCSCTDFSKEMHTTYNDGSQWFWPKSIAGVFSAINQSKGWKYFLVAGNTAAGVFHSDRSINTYIDINMVPELKQYSITSKALTLGGNLSLTDTMEIFKEAAKSKGFEYCQQLWNHFDLIANVPVRNMGTLAGNLIMKYYRKDFPSDIYILLEALNALIVLQESEAEEKNITIDQFLKSDMRGKIIKAFVLPPYLREHYYFDSYKIMIRAQNAHAYINAAFLINIQRPSLTVQSARICFGGISPDFSHASEIEKYVQGKRLYDPEVMANIFSKVSSHFNADSVLPDACPEYRLKLACGLIYKTILKHAPESVIPKKLKSGAFILKRPLSSGKQIYENVRENMPVHQPIEKYEGLMQTAGEASYANDVPVQANQLWAAFVTAKKVGATVINIDTSEAFQIPGVVAFLTSKDIPGKNTSSGNEPMFFTENEELFATGAVKYYNQPIGVLVAESNKIANEAAELVKLTYAGKAEMVFPTLHDVLNSACSDRIRHTVKSLIEKLKVEEKFDTHGSGTLDLGLQYHYFMEPHTTVVIPFEGGLEVYAATQWMDLLQGALTDMLDMQNNEIQIKVRRLGGGYGGKATRSMPAACAAALAALKLNCPVRFVQSIESMMNVLGKRWALHSDYEFFVKETGKIVALRNKFYEDAGCLPNESPMGHTVLLSKNCYEFSDNYKLDGYMIITDSPSNTPCRAPGSVEGIAMIENILEHISFETGLDPMDVRKANLIPGHKMEYLLNHFLSTSDYTMRKGAVKTFNEHNRWRKKGLGVAIMEYPIGYFGQFPATLAIYHGDGTVIISHGGIEMGQGMNTKISQIASLELGIPLNMIRFEGSNTVNGANSMVTGGSIGSETLCYAVRKCCNTINQRIKPVRESLKNPTWLELIQASYSQHISLIASEDCKPSDMDPYTVCALGLVEVEVDILTGNYQLPRVDILEDAGESLNPNVDIGQIEGAFMMGLGYWTSEEIIVDRYTGELKTNRTWNYKPPGAKDIPIDFRIELFPGTPNTAGFMRSKATGEPAICLSVAIGFALQEALQSSRSQAGLPKKWIPLKAPMTPERVLLESGTDYSNLHLY